MAVKEEFRSEGKVIISCLSADTKPSSYPASSIAYEMDTKKTFEYNGSEWRNTRGPDSSDNDAWKVVAEASATSSGAVTKSDSTVLDFNAIFIGGAGNGSVDHTEGGTAVVYTGVFAGTILPVAGVRINSTLTTSTNMTWMKW